MFPPAGTPKFEAARIIVCDQNVRPFQPGFLQACEALGDKSPANALPAASRVDRQMINITATPIMAAQHSPDHGRIIHRDSAQTGVSLQKSSDRFAIVTFGNVEAFDPVPKFDCRLVILDSKLSRLDRHRAEISSEHRSGQAFPVW
jgi:hypothetical protein